MIDVPWVYSGWIGVLPLLVPIIGYFMVINDMEPRKFFGGSRPVGRGIYLAILPSISFCVGSEPVRNVHIYEITQEKHEGSVELWYPFCQMLEPGDGERMGERVIRESGLDAA